LLQYGGSNADWVEALGGTYNSVEKIDTAISSINLSITTLQSNSSVTSTGLFIPTFSSATNCTASAPTSLGFSYYGQRFLNCFMLFALDVGSLLPSSFSVDVSNFPGTYNTTVTPNAIVSVSGGFLLYYTYSWSYPSGNATLSMTFSSAALGKTYGISAGTYNVSMNVWGIIDNIP